METPTTLLDVAATVADLTPVDWAALEAEAVDPVSRVALKRLRLLDRIVRACADIVPPGSATPAATDDAPQATWGPFTIHERIGRGTFGDVYRAHDRRLDRIVALKLLKRAENDEASAAEVIHEGQLLAKVRHPNVVTVYGAERIDGRVGVWMEFVDGRTLEEELRASGPLPPDKVIDVGLALCGALAAVHDAGLLHRDLKAQNVMRATDGRLLLTDFGAGRVRTGGDGTDNGPPELAGTPLYLAPEVLNGAPASVRSEIYGFGVLLYHLATGAFPVRGRALRELRDAHARGERVGTRAYRDKLPRALASVIDRSIDPDPAKRFGSVQELREALQRSRHIRRRVLAWTAAALATPFLGVAGLNLAWSMTPPLRVVGKTVVPMDAVDLEVLLAKGERLYLARREGRVFSIVPARIELGLKPEFDNAFLADINPIREEYLTLKPGDDGKTQLWTTPPSQQPHQVGRLTCMYAVWSPDGQRIACADGSKLLIATPDGENPRTVLALPAGSIHEPRWSPRADILRFSLRTSNRDRPNQRIWEVHADGTGLRPLLTPSSDPPDERRGVWVLGGQYFVFASIANGQSDLWAVREPRSALDWTRQNPVRLTEGPESFAERLAVSPDGTTIFTIGQRPRYKLVRYVSKTGRFEPYVGGVSAISVSFSPDGRSVAYIRYPERKLWRADADGGNARQIVHAPVEMNGAAWSPDNKWIAYRSRQEGENFKIFLLPVDGSGAARSINAKDREQGIPSWSPDGRKLCYRDVPADFGIPDGGEVLHIYDLDTGKVSDLRGSDGLWTCRWSPDGRYIAGVKIGVGSGGMMLRHLIEIELST